MDLQDTQDTQIGDSEAAKTQFDHENPTISYFPAIEYPEFIQKRDHKDVVKDIKAWLHEKRHGFGVSIHKTRKEKKIVDTPFPEITTVYLRCACGRSYEDKSKPREDGGRSSSSRMKGCMWRAAITRTLNDNNEYGWQFCVVNSAHNHQPAGVFGLPQYRQLDDSAESILADGVRYGTAPSIVYTRLIELHYYCTNRDVINAMRRLQRTELGGKTKLEALFGELQKDFRDEVPDPAFPHGEDTTPIKYFVRVKTDSENRLQTLFFAHPYSIEMVKEHPDVLMLDCTYKTNKFNMPFLHVVGVNSMTKTFSVAFCFLPNEQEASYDFAIDALDELFHTIDRSPQCFITDQETALKNSLGNYFLDVPQRLCLWHLINNLECQVLQIWGSNRASHGKEKENAAKKEQFMGRFSDIVQAEDEELFSKLYSKLKDDYALFPAHLQYIEDQIMPTKGEWAEYICQYFPCFGQRTTSRLEAAHSHLKQALVNRTGHIYDIVLDIHRLIRRSRNSLKAYTDQAETRVNTAFKIHHFQRLHSRITSPALTLLKQQIELAKDPKYQLGSCSGAFSSQYNLPCKHWLYVLLQKDPEFVIDPSQIGQHWWFYPTRRANDHSKYPLEPLTVKGKGRPKGAKGKGKALVETEEFKIDGRDLILVEYTRASNSTPSSSSQAKATPKIVVKGPKLALEKAPEWLTSIIDEQRQATEALQAEFTDLRRGLRLAAGPNDDYNPHLTDRDPSDDEDGLIQLPRPSQKRPRYCRDPPGPPQPSKLPWKPPSGR